MAKLFEQTIPELAMDGAAIVLLDELETLAVSRHQLSLEANPIDVHRATDAVARGHGQADPRSQECSAYRNHEFP